jgi:hypothetical protein
VWCSTSSRPVNGALAAAVALLALVAASATAHAATPRVQALVVGKGGWSSGPRSVPVSATRVNGCRVGAGLPIGVLRALRQPFRARGSCRSLYVFQVRGDRERGAGGWVYKVGRSLPSRSASDPGGRLRSGARVTWFWCRQAGRCDRTLGTSARSSGGRMRVTVTGYDDFGRGRRVPGATVVVRAVGSSRRTVHRSGADGTVLVPVRAGRRYRVDSRRAGMIRGFPATVRAR